MKVSIYVDWTNQKVLTEKDISEFREKKTEELLPDVYSCNLDFAEWLHKCDCVIDTVEENISELFEKIEIDIQKRGLTNPLPYATIKMQ